MLPPMCGDAHWPFGRTEVDSKPIPGVSACRSLFAILLTMVDLSPAICLLDWFISAEQQRRRNRACIAQFHDACKCVLDAQTIAGLRDGLKELGLEDGKRVVFEIHDTKGDPKLAEKAAVTLEQKKVDLIFSLPSSVSLIAQQATTSVPIVFYAGSDPVESGLVKTCATACCWVRARLTCLSSGSTGSNS